MGPGTKRAPRLGGSVKIGIVPRRRPRKPRSRGRDQNREFFPLSLSLSLENEPCAGTALRTIWIYFIAVDLFHPPLSNMSRMLMGLARDFTSERCADYYRCYISYAVLHWVLSRKISVKYENSSEKVSSRCEILSARFLASSLAWYESMSLALIVFRSLEQSRQQETSLGHVAKRNRHFACEWLNFILHARAHARWIILQTFH